MSPLTADSHRKEGYKESFAFGPWCEKKAGHGGEGRADVSWLALYKVFTSRLFHNSLLINLNAPTAQILVLLQLDDPVGHFLSAIVVLFTILNASRSSKTLYQFCIQFLVFVTLDDGVNHVGHGS